MLVAKTAIASERERPDRQQRRDDHSEDFEVPMFHRALVLRNFLGEKAEAAPQCGVPPADTAVGALREAVNVAVVP